MAFRQDAIARVVMAVTVPTGALVKAAVRAAAVAAVKASFSYLAL
jgi:hypothetical protein